MAEDNDVVAEKVINETNLGKAWAAMRNEEVVCTISMRVPSDVAFEDFRVKAADCLGLLGDVKSGELIERGGQRYFVRRPTHANRGKTPRKPKEFLIYQPKNV